MTGTFKTLGSPKDPDQVVQSESKILVAAHGDHEVIAIGGGHTEYWAKGSAPVALAPDTAKNVLVLVVNAHE
jgi:hypothetical protein